jgi:hypothetical protein
MDRFHRIWRHLRRYQICEGLGWTLLAFVLAMGALALVDYWIELSLVARSIGIGAGAMLGGLVFWLTVVVTLRWWSRPRTAAEMESRFPQLGQRIRTVVQYAGLTDDLMHAHGVAPSLVAALSEETQIQAEPLPLELIVPRRRAWAVAALAVMPVLALLAPALVDPDWRTTLVRLALIDRPYTTIVVAPGDVTVDQGDKLAITAELKGRKRARVVLQTRPAETSSKPWVSQTLAPSASGPATQRTATLETIRKPLLYRVVAEASASRTARVNVRYPLALTTFEVTLTPPAYTGLPAETVKGGDLRAVAGTEATFRMVFDALPREAALMVTEPKASIKNKEGSAPPPAPQVIPLVSDGKALTARLRITHDLDYAIVARAADGRRLPENGYRIDARADYPPRVSFDEPAEALEVHPIAEVLSRIRAADDFGLSKAGIVYRVNDGEEKTLIARDLSPPGAQPQAASRLEETLALEALRLTPTDSLTYYAFAEDNFPGGPRRTETDLRFIDIRPFKRSYRLNEGGGEDVGESTTLDELIARQRFNLNRTVRLAKHKPGDRTAPEDPLKIASFEELLAALTREVLDGFQAAAPDQFESLQQAEAAMVAAVDALDREKPTDASALEAEALSHLVEARRTFRFCVCENGSVQIRQRLRAFDRTQAQKIRKPNDQADAAEALVAEIEELAGDEEFVYATIAQLLGGPGSRPMTSKAELQAGQADNPRDATQGEQQKQTGPMAGREAAGKPERAEASGESTKKGKARGAMPGAEKTPVAGPPEKMDHRALAAEQGRIGDEARDLEERLKRLDTASELSRLRMAKAAESAERASGALTRGQSREAADLARGGARLLHEVARQVKGEIAREAADVVAMSRDLAEELAQREAEFAEMPRSASAAGSESGDTESASSDTGKNASARDTETDSEMLKRLAEAARTLQAWLEQLARRDDGKARTLARELLEQGKMTEILRQIERIAEMQEAGKRDAARREAADVAGALEAMARALDKLHREIVAPRLAALVTAEKDLAELSDRLESLQTDAEVDAWHRRLAMRLRTLEKDQDLTELVAELEKVMVEAGWRPEGGAWNREATAANWRAPAGYRNVLEKIARRVREQIQEMILKDMMSSRDETTPPEFKELVERYYEVLSREGGVAPGGAR